MSLVLDPLMAADDLAEGDRRVQRVEAKRTSDERRDPDATIRRQQGDDARP